MEIIKVSDLTPHPRNKEFFDDITGDNWELFLESVEQNGVIEPIVVTQELMIVSGHQRIKACKELEIEDILVRIKVYKEDEVRGLNIEDVILEELIICNIRNRAIPNNNPIKFGRCLKFLEEINGVKQGGDRKSKCKLFTLKTQQDLADEIGISKRTWQNYTKLTELIPEIQDLIQDGKVSSEVGGKIFAKMSDDEQEKLLSIIGIDKIANMNTKQVKNVVGIAKDNEKSDIETIREIIKTIEPADYIEIKEYVDIAKASIKKKDSELLELTKQIQQMRITDEGLAKAESKRKKLEQELIEGESKLQDINKLYGDATNTLKKQRQLNDLIDQHKDLIKLVESKFIGFVPHNMGKDNYDGILKEYRICLERSLDFVDELQGKEKYKTIEEVDIIEYDV